MRRGTTTMKMIKSTSTTSTSGVMLISDCRPLSESPTFIAMMSFSPRAGTLLRDQPHSAEPGLFDCDHGLTHLAKIEFCISPDHDPGFLLSAHRSSESVGEILRCDHLIVDPQFAGVVDGDQNPASLVALTARIRRVWHIDLRPLSHLRRHHHEDDQQHQHHVHERRDVDGRLQPGWLTESHEPP